MIKVKKKWRGGFEPPYHYPATLKTFLISRVINIWGLHIMTPTPIITLFKISIGLKFNSSLNTKEKEKLVQNSMLMTIGPSISMFKHKTLIS